MEIEFFCDFLLWACGVSLCNFKKSIYYKLIDSFSDEQGRLQILQFKIDDDKYIICNIYNDNVQKGQIEVLKMLYWD